MKNLLQDNLNMLNEMSVPEYTLYRKWVEIQGKYKVNDALTISKLPDFENNIKKNIWMPKNTDDYLKLDPEVILVGSDKNRSNIWNTLRIFCHRMPWNANPGRLLRFYVKDKITDKYLGLFSLGSDFIGIGGRDSYIGWTTDQKLKKGMLKHTAMGSTIAATQPLGYNYLGGKFMSLMVCSDVVEKAWNERYKEKLVGITTTSLYGGFSQYNRLSYWRKCQSSEGTIKLEPSGDVYFTVKEWYKKEFPDEYKKAQSGSHPKTRVLGLIYKKLGVKPPINNAPRGVYFCSLYDNSLEFLSMKDEQLKGKKFDNSVKTLTKLWIDKYATKRIENLSKENRLKLDILFYDDLIQLNWEDTKERFLED